MDAKCPYCTTIFPTDHAGIQTCPHCGSEVNVAATPASSGVPGPGPHFDTMQGTGGPSGPSGPLGHETLDVPWERQKELGVFRAFGETVSQSLTKPEAFFATVRPNGPLLPALVYAWVVSAISGILSFPFQLLSFGKMNPSDYPWMQSLPPGMQHLAQQIVEQTSSVQGVLGRTVGMIILFPPMMFLGAGILHLFCLLWGAGKNGFSATFRALCYSVGPNLFSFVPCVGFLAGLYTSILALIGIKQVQQTTYGRAIGATSTPTLLLCCCGGGLLAAIGLAVYSQFQS